MILLSTILIQPNMNVQPRVRDLSSHYSGKERKEREMQQRSIKWWVLWESLTAIFTLCCNKMTGTQIQTKIRSNFTQTELWRLLLIQGIDPVYMDSKSTFLNLWNENWEKYSFSFTILKKWQLCDNKLTDKGPER